jgi:hypothetical protein
MKYLLLLEVVVQAVVAVEQVDTTHLLQLHLIMQIT